MQISGTQIQNNTITQSKLALVDPIANADAVTLQFLNQKLFGLDNKVNARVATTASLAPTSFNTTSITKTGGLPTVIDGVTLVVGERILVKNETLTNAPANKVYIYATGNTWQVAADSYVDANPTLSTLSSGAIVLVSEGTINGKISYQLNTPDPLSPSTGLLWAIFNFIQAPTPTIANKETTLAVTTVDFQTTGIAIVNSPANGSYVGFAVNGLMQAVGNGVRTADCYFSGDGGATAKTFANITSGDVLYWVGSVAGFQLSATMKGTLYYNV
jgi:hypothetical protein